MARDDDAQAGERARDAAAMTATKRQILDIIEELPFEDEPASFLRALDELAAKHGVDHDQ